jgi:hypothetical protein
MCTSRSVEPRRIGAALGFTSTYFRKSPAGQFSASARLDAIFGFDWTICADNWAPPLWVQE